MKLPKFKSIGEERAFWDTHSITDYLTELRETDEIVFERPALVRNFQLRLDGETIKKLKILARKRHIDVSTILRAWIRLHLDRELKSA